MVSGGSLLCLRAGDEAYVTIPQSAEKLHIQRMDPALAETISVVSGILDLYTIGFTLIALVRDK